MFYPITHLFLFAIAVTYVRAAVQTNYSLTKTDPAHIDFPSIPQTVAHDIATECTHYSSPYDIIPSEWPAIWDIATSNGMDATAEFKALYNSIDWTKAPNIPVRTITPAGGLDTVGYDTVNDPDCWWSVSQCSKPKRPDILADIRECPEPRTWGLTFDDGPNCSHNAFYDFLLENNQKASMFYIGSNVLNWPYGALRGIKDGHHLASHTWSHKMMTTLTNQEVLAELYYSVKAIKYVAGVTPLYWRPALGDIDDRVRWIATQLNLTAILWNLDTDDWAANSVPGITSETVNQSYEAFIAMGNNGTFGNKGNIVLSHEINNMTMEFFVRHYPEIKKAYTHVVDVATCMNISYPYMEQAVALPSFDGSIQRNTGTGTSGSGVIPAASQHSNASHDAPGSWIMTIAISILAGLSALNIVA